MTEEKELKKKLQQLRWNRKWTSEKIDELTENKKQISAELKIVNAQLAELKEK